LTNLCKDAALGPIRELGSKLIDTPQENVRPIQLKDFEQALKNIRPSVSEQSLKGYEQWNKEYGMM